MTRFERLIFSTVALLLGGALLWSFIGAYAAATREWESDCRVIQKVKPDIGRVVLVVRCQGFPEF